MINCTHLRCPRSHQQLRFAGTYLQTEDRAYIYPIVDGVPILLSYDPSLEKDKKNLDERQRFALTNLRRYNTIDFHRYERMWSQYVDPTEAKRIIGEILEQYAGLNLGQELRVLDVGCGSGYLILNLLLSGRVTEGHAIDISYQGPWLCSRKAISLGLTVCASQADIYALPYEDNTFDLVVGNNVLHHIPDLRWAASEIMRVLTPGGYAAFIEPSPMWAKASRFSNTLLSPIRVVRCLSKYVFNPLAIKDRSPVKDPHEPSPMPEQEYLHQLTVLGGECRVRKFHVLGGFLRSMFISKIMRIDIFRKLSSFCRTWLLLAYKIDRRVFVNSPYSFYNIYVLHKLGTQETVSREGIDRYET